MSSGTREMALYIAGRLAGHVLQDENGALSFSYAPDYLGAPVSLFMPLSPMTYRQHVVRPYLMGLLSDDPTVRADIADRYGCSGENPFACFRTSASTAPEPYRSSQNRNGYSLTAGWDSSLSCPPKKWRARSAPCV